MRRREVIRASLVTGGWLIGCGPGGELPDARRFRRGVASGDPGPDRVVLWTHLAEAVGDEPLVLVVARDAELTDVVLQTELVAYAARDHTVEVEVDGLAPATTYHYAFEVAEERSRVGRVRTAPSGATDAVRFAFVTCASYAHGFFHVYARVADRDELDAVVHLGDYIYEYGNGGYGDFRGYDPPHEVITLRDYRRRYAHYRLDRELQRAHARHPFIVTWDDHELANNAWRGGAIEHDPATKGPWAERREAATQAHREWLPRRDLHPGSLYRRFSFGALVDLFVLDTRLEGRDRPPWDEDDAQSPSRSILGAAQRERFLAELRASEARWKIVAHSVQLSPHREFWNHDAWDGYAHDRRLILETIARTPIDGVIFVCGDGHKSFADDLPLDPWDREAYDPATGRGSVAVELMTPAVTSPNAFGEEARALERAIVAGSPHTKLVEAESRGYWTLELREDRAEAELFFVRDVEDPAGGRERSAGRFEVLPGAPRLRRLD